MEFSYDIGHIYESLLTISKYLKITVVLLLRSERNYERTEEEGTNNKIKERSDWVVFTPSVFKLFVYSARFFAPPNSRRCSSWSLHIYRKRNHVRTRVSAT